ncbi:MAG: winged helix-turn-helix transcriptional regulator [Gemmatimonadota bacterium]
MQRRKYAAGLSQRELAAITGLSFSAVRKRLERLRARLRARAAAAS